MESQIRNNQNISTLLCNNRSLLLSFLYILQAHEPLGKLSKLRKDKEPNLNLVKKCTTCFINRGLIPTELLKQPMTSHAPTNNAEEDGYIPPEEVYQKDAVYAPDPQPSVACEP